MGGVVAVLCALALMVAACAQTVEPVVPPAGPAAAEGAPAGESAEPSVTEAVQAVDPAGVEGAPPVEPEAAQAVDPAGVEGAHDGEAVGSEQGDDTAATGTEAGAGAGGSQLAQAEGMAFDHGVDPEAGVIRVGLNVGLSGPFRWRAGLIAEGQLAYWDWLNDAGGIDGWKVEPVVMDNAYEVDRHLENYEIMAGEGEQSVVMFSSSGGTPTTLATVERLAEDSMAAIPHSYYSGWGDPAIGSNLFETLANYCVESINGANWMRRSHGERAAVVTFAGPYGEDGAEGVKIAAEELDFQIVFDGQGAVTRGGSLAHVVEGIVESGADWVWLATDPVTTVALLKQAYDAGYRGEWSGNSPSWSPWIMATDAALIAGGHFTVSARLAQWDADGPPGMQKMIEGMRRYRPDAAFDDVYAVGWVQGYAVTAILEQAIAQADLTRAGVLEAARQVTVDLEGLAPDHTWSGDPNENLVRGTYLYDVSLHGSTVGLTWAVSVFDDSPEAGPQFQYIPDKTVSDQDASNGYSLLAGPYVSRAVEDWQYKVCHR